MNSIRPLSFGTNTSAFQDMISKPQTYRENPAPASSFKSPYAPAQPKKKHTFAKLLVTAAAVATALGVGAKKGWFNTEKLTNETCKKFVGYLNTAGNAIADKAISAFDSCKKFISGLTSKKEEVAEAVEQVTGS